MSRKPKQTNWSEPSEVHELSSLPPRDIVNNKTFVEVGGKHFCVQEERKQPSEYLVLYLGYEWLVCEGVDGTLEVVDEPDVDEKLPLESTIVRAVIKHRARQVLER